MKHKNYTEILSLPPDALKKRQKTKGWALSFVQQFYSRCLCRN